jgi:DNA-binding NarL/FixJ family response regulator
MAHLIRVLLADDSERMRRAIRMVLAVEPAIRIVAEVETYSDLVKLPPDSRADVLLMDIHMPGV